MKRDMFRLMVAIMVIVVGFSSCVPMHHGQRRDRGHNNDNGNHRNGY